jgi:hypothetical protein
LLILVLCLLTQWAWSDPTPEDPVTSRQVTTGDGVVIYCANRLGNDMTVTLEFTRSSNVEASPGFPCTVTVPGHSEVKMATLRKHDPGRGWDYYYMYYWNFGSIHARHDDSVVYALPYPSGQSYKVIQGFHGAFSHRGDDEYALDFSHPEGTPVLAAREGTVVHAEERYSRGAAEEFYRNRVNVLRIRHSDGTIGEYDHFRPDGIVVEEGQSVRRGELLGYSGHTGFATGPHLHFVVYAAKDGHRRRSFPIRFRVAGASEPVELTEGQFYLAP